MAAHSAGLYKRGRYWHIDKEYLGQRIRGSCKTGEFNEALEVLAQKMEEVRQAKLFGARPKRTFRTAAAQYLRTKQKRSLADDAMHLKVLDRWIGDKYLDDIHDDTLAPFKQHRLQVDGVKRKTVNMALSVVRHILNLCATTWRDNGLTWLTQAPRITMYALTDAAEPYPLTWDDQRRLFAELNDGLAKMALFKVNTGAREHEVCRLRWEWEYAVPGASVFAVPGELVKNAKPRILVLNRVAASIVEDQRGLHKEFVFVGSRGQPLQKMNNNPWRQAWKRAGLPVDPKYKRGVHNLKHTFGQRLRAAGVSEEDRQFLLGHRTASLTTHYSAPEIRYFIDLANRVCEQREEIFLRRVS